MSLTQDDACLICHNEIYLNPNMKLMMAVCGHKFCESCVTLTFIKAVAMNCPACPTQLKKNSFILQSTDDSALQKDNLIRKRIHKIYNKRREDFPSSSEYNDYLETVEDIIFNLLTNTDVEATNEKVKRYQAENQQLIHLNVSKKAFEENAIKEKILNAEKDLQEQRRKHILEDQEEAKKRLQERLEQIQNNSKGLKGKPAAKKKEKEKEKEDKKDLRITISVPATTTAAAPAAPDRMQYLPSMSQSAPTAQPMANAPALAAQPLSSAPASSSQPVDIKTRERAGGYREEYVKSRALEEAFASFFVPSKQTSISLTHPSAAFQVSSPMEVA